MAGWSSRGGGVVKPGTGKWQIQMSGRSKAKAGRLSWSSVGKFIRRAWGQAAGGPGTETLRMPPTRVVPSRGCIMIRFVAISVVAISLTTGAVAGDEPLLSQGSPARNLSRPCSSAAQH